MEKQIIVPRIANETLETPRAVKVHTNSKALLFLDGYGHDVLVGTTWIPKDQSRSEYQEMEILVGTMDPHLPKYGEEDDPELMGLRHRVKEQWQLSLERHGETDDRDCYVLTGTAIQVVYPAGHPTHRAVYIQCQGISFPDTDTVTEEKLTTN